MSVCDCPCLFSGCVLSPPLPVWLATRAVPELGPYPPQPLPATVLSHDYTHMTGKHLGSTKLYVSVLKGRLLAILLVDHSLMWPV